MANPDIRDQQQPETPAVPDRRQELRDRVREENRRQMMEMFMRYNIVTHGFRPEFHDL